MKNKVVIIFLSVLAGVSGTYGGIKAVDWYTHRPKPWTAVQETYAISGCTSTGATQSACECGLHQIEQKYTFEEVSAFTSLPSGLEAQLAKCN